jgi:hypothetical protein
MFTCIVVIPRVNGLFVQFMTEPRQRAHLFMQMTIIARLMLLVVGPVMTTIIFDDGCLQQWKLLWDPCTQHTDEFDLSFNDSYTGRDVVVMTTSNICETKYPHGRCARRVVETTSLLMTQKLVFLALLLPVWNCTKAFAGPVVSDWAEFFGLHKFATTLRAASLEVDLDRVGILAITLLEVAVVYGLFAPIVALCTCFAIGTNLITQRWLIISGSVVVRPVTSRPPFSYLFLSVAIQSTLIFWFCVDNTINGSGVVTVGLPFVLFFAILSRFHVVQSLASMIYDRINKVHPQPRQHK